MRKVAIMLVLIVSAVASHSQSKVFREVDNEIASTMRVLTQDNSLVGYLMFTRLEAVSEDSFAYKITIMDENLNDIGAVNFREQSLQLHAVSFDQDVICLSYFKSNYLGKKFKNKKAYKEASGNAKFTVMTQFVDLTGKIFKTNSSPVTVKADDLDMYYTGSAMLNNTVQLKNVSQTGFASFYGDENNNYLSLYNFKGEELWKKTLSKEKLSYTLFATNNDIFLYTQNTNIDNKADDEITGYNIKDNSIALKYTLKDKKTGNSLKVMGIGNDPVTHMPYLTGRIVLPKIKYVAGLRAKELTKGNVTGLFTINLNGSNKKDIVESFSYWSDESKLPEINRKGRFSDTKYYLNYAQSFKDYNGNSYFVGSGITKRTKFGSIFFTALTLPSVFIPLFIAGGGYNKFAVRDAVIVKQDAKGNLNMERTLDGEKVNVVFKRSTPIDAADPKRFYTVTNEATKSQFVIMDDVKKIIIYNVNQKKVVRTIPHKDGNIRTNIYPAKEGHIMVSEYNRKEGYTRVSIESL